MKEKDFPTIQSRNLLILGNGISSQLAGMCVAVFLMGWLTKNGLTNNWWNYPLSNSLYFPPQISAALFLQSA